MKIGFTTKAANGVITMRSAVLRYPTVIEVSKIAEVP
jgi:hypothetical protein